MDPLGEVLNEFMRQSHAKHARVAIAMASDLSLDGMNRSQVREMLHASGFDEDVIKEAMASLPPSKKIR